MGLFFALFLCCAVAGAGHGAVGTVAAAGGFALFLIFTRLNIISATITASTRLIITVAILFDNHASISEDSFHSV